MKSKADGEGKVGALADVARVHGMVWRWAKRRWPDLTYMDFLDAGLAILPDSRVPTIVVGEFVRALGKELEQRHGEPVAVS